MPSKLKMYRVGVLDQCSDIGPVVLLAKDEVDVYKVLASITGIPCIHLFIEEVVINGGKVTWDDVTRKGSKNERAVGKEQNQGKPNQEKNN